jgi:predicted dienelactone hydrolase
MMISRRLFALALAGSAAWVPALAQVGMAQLPNAPEPVTLVYPTSAISKPVTRGPFTIDVALDAPPRPGRHRLIVMSHGTAGSPLSDHDLAAAFARAGFVVAQLLHQGDNHQDTSLAGPESFRLRPLEVSRVIDRLANDPKWAASLDLARVGVHGMSAGGVTAFSLAGAQWRTLNLVRHCQQYSVEDEGFCFQGASAPSKRAERQARYDRARHVPEFLLPADLKTWHGGQTPTQEAPEVRPDLRVASVTAAVPVVAPFSAESLSRIRIPVGIVSARLDQVLLPRFHSDYALAHCKSCTRLADLPAGHFDVLGPWPASVAREVAATQTRGGLVTPGFDQAARVAANAKIVEFHQRHLEQK